MLSRAPQKPFRWPFLLASPEPWSPLLGNSSSTDCPGAHESAWQPHQRSSDRSPFLTLRFRGDRKQAGLTDLVVRKGRCQRKTERKLHLAARKLSGSRLRRWTESSIPEGLYLMWEGYLECHGGSCRDLVWLRSPYTSCSSV